MIQYLLINEVEFIKEKCTYETNENWENVFWIIINIKESVLCCVIFFKYEVKCN